MNKLIAAVYALYLVFFMIGCVSDRADYEIHLFMDKGSEVVKGYVEIEGVEHQIEVRYNED